METPGILEKHPARGGLPNFPEVSFCCLCSAADVVRLVQYIVMSLLTVVPSVPTATGFTGGGPLEVAAGFEIEAVLCIIVVLSFSKVTLEGKN